MHLAANSLFLLAQARDPGFFEKFLGSPAGSLIPFLAVGFVFYFLLMRPERRKRQELEKMLEGLNKDDQVVTIGGIWGVVVNAAKGSEFITVRVDEGSGAKLRILRSAVSRVITDGTAGKEGST